MLVQVNLHTMTYEQGLALFKSANYRAAIELLHREQMETRIRELIQDELKKLSR